MCLTMGLLALPSPAELLAAEVYDSKRWGWQQLNIIEVQKFELVHEGNYIKTSYT